MTKDKELTFEDVKKEIKGMFERAKQSGDGTLSLSPEYREKLEDRKRKQNDQ